MAKIKHKFSKIIYTPDGSTEIFEASEADSWEEARKVVNKGVYDRQLELNEEQIKRDAQMKKTLEENKTSITAPGKIAIAPGLNTSVSGNPGPNVTPLGTATTSTSLTK